MGVFRTPITPEGTYTSTSGKHPALLITNRVLLLLCHMWHIKGIWVATRRHALPAIPTLLRGPLGCTCRCPCGPHTWGPYTLILKGSLPTV